MPFVQSTMSNDTMGEVASAAPGVRHWWQLYVFGGDEVWQELLRRADHAGCEALVLTTNTQIFGDREWQRRNQVEKKRLAAPVALESLAHPGWIGRNLLAHGIPGFPNVIDFVPKDQRGFFATSHWIREHQPTSMTWDTVAKIRQRWHKPFILKGILSPEDVRRASTAGSTASCSATMADASSTGRSRRSISCRGRATSSATASPCTWQAAFAAGPTC